MIRIRENSKLVFQRTKREVEIMDRDRLRKVSNRFPISDIYVAKWNSGWRYFFTKYAAGCKDDTLHRVKMVHRHYAPRVKRYDKQRQISGMSIALMREAICNAGCSCVQSIPLRI